MAKESLPAMSSGELNEPDTLVETLNETIDTSHEQQPSFDDLLDLLGGASQEQYSDTISQLEEYFGGRVFTYGRWSGTVQELGACPAFQLQVSNGFEAAKAWLLENDGQIVEEEDDPVTEETDTEEADDPATPVLKDEQKIVTLTEKKTPEPTVKDTVAETHQNAVGPVQPEVSPAVAAQPTETKVDISQGSSVQQSSETLDGGDQSQVVALQNHEQLLAQKPEDPSVEPEAKDSGRNVATAEMPDTPQAVVDMAPEQSQEPVEYIIKLHAIEDDEQTEEGTEPIPSEVVDGVDTPVELLDDVELSNVVVDVPQVTDLDIESNLEGVDTLSDDSEVSEQLDASVTEELESSKATLVHKAVEHILDEPMGDEAEEMKIDQMFDVDEITNLEPENIIDEVIETLKEPQPLNVAVVEFMAELVGELPEAIEEGEGVAPVQIFQQAAVVTYRIDRLSKATTASECHEELSLLRVELINLLALIGYEYPEQVAEELLHRYDVATLRRYMKALIRTITISQGLRVNSTRTTATSVVANYQCGAHAVRMSVQLAA